MVRRLTSFLVLLFGVGAFVPRSVHTNKTTKIFRLPIDVDKGCCHNLGHCDPSDTSLQMVNDKKENSEGVGLFEKFKDRPGTLVMIPFLIIFGVDILLNIAVLVKRTFEYFVLGQAPSSEPWW